MTIALLVTAGLFAIVAGANDGSSILGAGLRVPGMRPAVSMVILLAAVVLGPLVIFGTGVADTLAHKLVPFAGGSDADAALLVAALSAVVVVFALTRAGLPTSLTLALIGAITGAGLGAGLPVNGSELGLTLLAGLASPVVAGLVAFPLSRVALRAIHGRSLTRRARRLHIGAYILQCLAYSANGGQKMLAVFAIAAGSGSAAHIREPWWLLLIIAALFSVGILTGLRRVASSLSRGILTVHLRHTLVAEICSAAAVMAAGLTGIPLTMSQSVTGSLVGAGMSESMTRVRWPAAIRMAGAWIVTLPASIGLAALAGGATRWL